MYSVPSDRFVCADPQGITGSDGLALLSLVSWGPVMVRNWDIKTVEGYGDETVMPNKVDQLRDTGLTEHVHRPLI
jgi:hypothetical protein